MTGNEWYDYSDLITDPEKKITEFDYENYIHPRVLKNVKTDSEDFKTLIKVLNLITQTNVERHE